MLRKGHNPEQVLNKLRQVEVAVAGGKSVGVAVREIGVTDHTHSTPLRCRLGNQVFFGAILSIGSNGLRDLITP